MAEEYDIPDCLVTDELIKSLNTGKLVASEVGATLPGITEDKQQQFLLEAVEAFGEGKLELDKVFAAIGAAGLNGDISTDLAEALWLASLRPKAKHELLGELTAECIKKGKFNRRQALEYEEIELLVQSGVIATEKQLGVKERRLYTNMFYKQDKYNLLREENEGYGKLLTALLSGGQLQQQHLPALRREIKSLIGAFKLDPNRVCDLVLEAAEKDVAGQAVWLQLMPLFNKDAPMLMLAMKFLHYQQDHTAVVAGDEQQGGSGAAAALKSRPAPASLFQLAAAMIKAGLASLECLLSYLSPSADALAATYKSNLQQLQEEISQLALASTGGGLDQVDADTAGVAGSAGNRRLALLANLDELAKERGITNAVDDAMSNRSTGPRGGGPTLQQQSIGYPMQPPPPVGPPGAFQRGLAPVMGPGPSGMIGSGMRGDWGPGSQPGVLGPAGMTNGLVSGGPMGSAPSAGGMGGSSKSGATAASGAAGGAAYEASYNVMSASQLEFDARPYDRQLLDGSTDHLQLLLALMKGGDWEHAMLMLEWLQDVLGVQAVNNLAICTALLAQLKTLFEPIYKALYPKGPLGGSVLDRPPYSHSSRGSNGKNLSQQQQHPGQPCPAPGPELDPVAYTLLQHVGVYVHRDAEVLVMMLRVLKHELVFYGGLCLQYWMQQPSVQQVHRDKVAQVCKVLSDVAIPALALHPSNLALSHELWDVLELLTFPNRAEVYRAGLAASAASPPAAAAGHLAVKAFKKIKARLALPDKADKSRKDVVRANAHLLSKVTHATPLQVTDQIMSWAGSFPNAVEPLAEVMKLPNPLTTDVLTYMALYWWGRLAKPKMKQDGANEEDWVQGVGDLVGYACRTHPAASFDLPTILRFLFDGLKYGDALNLFLLRNVLSKMTGIDGPVSLDPSQAQLLCAGYVMQSEVIHSVANRAEPRFVKGRRVLLEVLDDGDSSPQQQLLVPLAVVMSQQLDYVTYALPTQHIKEVAELHDRVNEVTLQYLMYMEHCIANDNILPLARYAAQLPRLHELIGEYGVQLGIAWHLWRPVFAALESELMPTLEAKAAATAAAGDADDDADALASLAADHPAAVKHDGEEGELPEEGEAMQGVEGPGVKVEATANGAALANGDHGAAAVGAGLPVSLADVIESVQQIHPKMFDILRVPLYMVFWSLKPEEIYVPQQEYDQRISEMERMLRTGPGDIKSMQQYIDREQGALDRMTQGHGRMGGRPGDENRIIDNITARQNQLVETKVKLEHAQAVIGPLKQERDVLLSRHHAVMRRLNLEKDTYVKEGVRLRDQNSEFVRHCLLPRLTRSVADATFCHHFTMAMHTLNVPHWPAGFFWDHAVTALTRMIPTVTEKEALCVGVFVTLLLQDLQDWYFDKDKYTRECSQQTMRHAATNPEPMTHTQFLKLFKKWQTDLHKILKACVGGSEYLQKRNALMIMSKMIQASATNKPPMFPFFKHHNSDLQNQMEIIMQNDAREDVKKMAQALKIQLHNCLDRCAIDTGPAKGDQAKGQRGSSATAAKGRVPPPRKNSPAKPQQQQQQQAGSRPTTPAVSGVDTPASAAVGGGDGANAAAAKPPAAGRPTGQQQPAAAAPGGTQGPKAVRKGGVAGTALKAVQAAAAATAPSVPQQQNAATAAAEDSTKGGSNSGNQQQQQHKRADTGAVVDEPASKRPRVNQQLVAATKPVAYEKDQESGEVSGSPLADEAAAAAAARGSDGKASMAKAPAAGASKGGPGIDSSRKGSVPQQQQGADQTGQKNGSSADGKQQQQRKQGDEGGPSSRVASPANVQREQRPPHGSSRHHSSKEAHNVGTTEGKEASREHGAAVDGQGNGTGAAAAAGDHNSRKSRGGSSRDKDKERDKDKQRDREKEQHDNSEQRKEAERDKDRERDRSHDGGGEHKGEKNDSKRRDRRDKKGSSGGGNSSKKEQRAKEQNGGREESEAKRRRIDDDRTSEGGGKEQQGGRHSSSGGHQAELQHQQQQGEGHQQQQQQPEQQRPKHEPIQFPTEDKKENREQRQERRSGRR